MDLAANMSNSNSLEPKKTKDQDIEANFLFYFLFTVQFTLYKENQFYSETKYFYILTFVSSLDNNIFGCNSLSSDSELKQKGQCNNQIKKETYTTVKNTKNVLVMK